MKANFKNAKRLSLLGAVLMGLAAPAYSSPITVPDGGFTSVTNTGSVGGILGSGSNLAIGSTGPWLGNYFGVAGLLLGPSLNISSSTNQATISGILGVNVLGLLNNGGDFTTTLTNAGSGAAFAYAANTVYTLTANVSAGTVLALSALVNNGVGIALTSGGNIVASISNAPSLLTLLSGNNYSLSMQYTTPTTGGPTGAIGIELYDLPSGLLTANLLSSVSFSNVALDATSTPEPAALILSGAGLLGIGLIRRRKRMPRGIQFGV